MADRLAQLLLKAVRALPPAEQDEVLAILLRGGVPGLLGPGGGAAQAVRLGDVSPWWAGRQPVGTRDALGRQAAGEEGLKVLPVRLPVADYDELRAFSREHGFSMAVIVRTLVERFLAAQARRRRDDDDADEPTTAGHA